MLLKVMQALILNINRNVAQEWLDKRKRNCEAGKTAESSKGQILRGGGLSRIIIDPLARRIHARTRFHGRSVTERSSRRRFTWLLLIYYGVRRFRERPHTVVLPAVKSSPADRSPGVSWNLLVTAVWSTL